MVNEKVHGNAKYRNSIDKINIITRILSRTTPTYKDGKVKKDMNIGAACAEEGITHQHFRKWLRDDPYLMRMYEENVAAKLELMRSMAKNHILEALGGGKKLKDKEMVDISLRFLEKTDDAWRDKHELEVKIQDFNMSTEDLERKARELIGNLKQSETYE